MCFEKTVQETKNGKIFFGILISSYVICMILCKNRIFVSLFRLLKCYDNLGIVLFVLQESQQSCDHVKICQKKKN